MNFRFGKKFSGTNVVIATILLALLFGRGILEWSSPYSYIAAVLFSISYLAILFVWLGSNYIWPPEEKKEE